MIDKIKYIRFSQVIEDPFPEHSDYSRHSPLYSLFGIGMGKPEEISIWKAYRMGYEKAYEELEKGLSSD